jgi:predicted PurR-regulated permease PerM
MFELQIIVILFFALLIVYSLIASNIASSNIASSNNMIEGMDDISTSNAADIISIKKELNELSEIDNKINVLDTQSKINSEEINILVTKMAQMTKKK